VDHAQATKVGIPGSNEHGWEGDGAEVALSHRQLFEAFTGLVRKAAFSLCVDSPQATVNSQTSHPQQLANRTEQPLPTSTEVYVLLPQFASLRLASLAEDALPTVHRHSRDTNRSPPRRAKCCN
jgi:hypothetical protein